MEIGELRKKIIFSADDFGISNLANVNILEMVRLGKLDRVSVMISDNLHPAEIEELKNFGVKLDIHLHLIKHESDYWRGNRRFKESVAKRLVPFMFNYLTGRKSPDKVELQWAVQIETFKELFGKSPDGIGSHEYIHFFPPFFRAVLNLAKRYEIPFVRLGKKNLGIENRVAKILNWLRSKDLKYLNGANFKSSDFMASFDWIENWEDFSQNLPGDQQTEMVFHPERVEEMEFLKKLS